MGEMELFCFKIISAVGDAKSSYIEALEAARNGNIAEARKKMNEGKEAFKEGHNTHMELLSTEASGNTLELSLLLVHAEDQLNSAEIIEVLAEQIIALHEKNNLAI